MIAWWLVAAALGEEQYNIAMNFIRSPLGIFMMFGWSVAFYYHLFNGVRHLIWDTGAALNSSKPTHRAMWYLLLTALATAATWYEVYN
jgi:succinate dehydrogenase / fumarate reductase cytochrome b subunit